MAATARQVATTNTPVLIVGAGPAGLVTALELARQGVRSIVVERHPGTSIFPRATAVSTRSMEILRSAGLEDEIRAFSAPVAPFMAVGPTLAALSPMAMPLGFPTPEQTAAVSPTGPAVSPQDHVEPVIVRRLESLGLTELRFDTELVAIEQGGGVVTARLADRRNGAESTVVARFVVGADGARSTVRDLLGIRAVGPTGLDHHAAILFRADLWSVVGERRFGLYAVGRPDAMTIVVPTGPDDRWVVAAPADPNEAARLAADPAAATAVVRAAAGVPDLPVEIIAVMPLVFSADIADRWRDGNVFLIGDAAHRMPPYGGRGMNTAIADANNLAWKLAWVVRGIAGQSLLDSFEEERGPVGRMNIALALSRFADRLAESGLDLGLADGPLPESTPDGLAEDLGYVYASSAIAAESRRAAEPESAAEPGPGFCQTAEPGARLPHAWLAFDGGRVSTLDLVDAGLVLLVAGPGGAWRRAARAIQPTYSLLTFLGSVGPAMPPPPTAPISVRAIGGRGLVDPDGSFGATFGLADGGAVLVRPDGHVAARWRTAPADHRMALAEAVATATGIGPRRAEPAAPRGELRPAGSPVPQPAG